MKESNFYSDEFEQLIREKTEQYKMYPSENVWKGVHNSLHTKRKWFIGTMALMVTGILYLSGKELISPSAHAPSARKLAATGGSMPDGTAADGNPSDLSRTSPSENTNHVGFNSMRPVNSVGGAGRHNNSLSENTGQEEPDQIYKGLTISISHPVVSQPDLSGLLSRLSDKAPSLPVTAEQGMTAANPMGKTSEAGHAEPGLLDSWLVRNGPENPAGRKGTEGAATGTRANGEGSPVKETAETTALRETTEGNSRETDVAGSDEITARGVLESLSAKGQQKAHNLSRNSLAKTREGKEAVATGDVLPDSAGIYAQASTTAIGEAVDRQRINWLHDYAMYTLPASPRRGRTLLQFTLTPTVNYRTLAGSDFAPPKSLSNGVLAPTHPGDAQTYAIHTPALGFEFGGSLLYRVTRNLTLKGGLQFSFSRYKIQAYVSSKPQQATITLNSSYGEYVDSINSMTTIGNFGGSSQVTLNNDYYQLSAPVGFELRILGNERLQFNIGATIQPSYLLNTNSYMLTADYTNYTKEPSLFRRWNVSGGVEAFLSYQTGPLRWQIGPEFRYQLLSTYSSQYPITENLKGYGLKIGITKMLP